MSNCYSCTFSSFRSENVGFVRHLFDAHSLESSFNYVCGISSCDRNFVTGTTYEAFHNHCTRYHHNWRQNIIPTIGVKEGTGGTTGAATADSSIDDHDINCVEDSMLPCETYACLETDGTEVVTVCKSRIDDTSRMKMVTGKFIIQTVNNITELSANSIKQSVMKELQESGGTITPSLDQCFLPINPFDELKTEYQQTMFFKEEFGLVVSG